LVGVGVESSFAGRTEASTVGVVADETGIAVLAVVNVGLSCRSELSTRAGLTSVGFLVIVFSR
jgi:hypothetical protein